MAVLTGDAFKDKWVGKFADNEIQNIDEPMLRELVADIRDSFANQADVNASPVPPAVNFDPVTRGLTAQHPLGVAELEYSHSNSGFTAYAPLAIDDLAHAQGEWRFRVKAATGRNASQTTDSPAITVKATVTPAGPGTIKSTAISDSTAAGRALLTAADVATQRTLLDVLNLTAGQYGAGQPKFDTLFGKDGALAYLLRAVAGATAPLAPTAGQVDDTADTFSFLPNPAYPSFAQYKASGLPGVSGAVVLDGVNSYVQGNRIYVKVVGAVAKGSLAVYVAGSGSLPDGAVLTNADPFTGTAVTPTPALTAALAISVASLTLGSALTFTVTPGGGTAPYSYQVVATNTATGQTTVLGTTASGSWTPSATGSYTLDATVTDSSSPAKMAQAATRYLQVQAAQNRIPVADAGQDVTIQLPTSSVALMGSGSDPDPGDSIASQAWRQITGPNNAGGLPTTTQNVVATGLVAGTYQFGFRTTDTHGAQSVEDFVVVTVQAATQPSSPVPVAADGMSIVHGNDLVNTAPPGTDPDSWPGKAWAKLGSQYVFQQNYARNGQTIAQRLADLPATIQAIQAGCSGYATPPVLYFNAAVNSAAVDGWTADQCYLATKQYVDQCTAAGIRVIVDTATGYDYTNPNGAQLYPTAQVVATLDEFNQMLNAGWRYDLGAWGNPDMGSDPNMGLVPGQTFPSAYWTFDKLHPNKGGYAYMGEQLMAPAYATVGAGRYHGVTTLMTRNVAFTDVQGCSVSGNSATMTTGLAYGPNVQSDRALAVVASDAPVRGGFRETFAAANKGTTSGLASGDITKDVQLTYAWVKNEDSVSVGKARPYSPAMAKQTPQPYADGAVLSVRVLAHPSDATKERVQWLADSTVVFTQDGPKTSDLYYKTYFGAVGATVTNVQLFGVYLAYRTAAAGPHPSTLLWCEADSWDAGTGRWHNKMASQPDNYLQPSLGGQSLGYPNATGNAPTLLANALNGLGALRGNLSALETLNALPLTANQPMQLLVVARLVSSGSGSGTPQGAVAGVGAYCTASVGSQGSLADLLYFSNTVVLHSNGATTPTATPYDNSAFAVIGFAIHDSVDNAALYNGQLLGRTGAAFPNLTDARLRLFGGHYYDPNNPGVAGLETATIDIAAVLLCLADDPAPLYRNQAYLSARFGIHF